eukprot:scaffold1154_cov310-Pinguiococcus_pyrenoidosus.AAC.18
MDPLRQPFVVSTILSSRAQERDILVERDERLGKLAEERLQQPRDTVHIRQQEAIGLADLVRHVAGAGGRGHVAWSELARADANHGTSHGGEADLIRPATRALSGILLPSAAARARHGVRSSMRTSSSHPSMVLDISCALPREDAAVPRGTMPRPSSPHASHLPGSFAEKGFHQMAGPM